MVIIHIILITINIQDLKRHLLKKRSLMGQDTQAVTWWWSDRSETNLQVSQTYFEEKMKANCTMTTVRCKHPPQFTDRTSAPASIYCTYRKLVCAQFLCTMRDCYIHFGRARNARKAVHEVSFSNFYNGCRSPLCSMCFVLSLLIF